jgi:hypothetical protein
LEIATLEAEFGNNNSDNKRPTFDERDEDSLRSDDRRSSSTDPANVNLDMTGDSLTDDTEQSTFNPDTIKKPFVWYMGTVFFVAGSILNFISFSFAAQSLLSALGSAQFISNVIFGRFILKEVVTRQTLIATGTILVGNALVVFFSSHTSVIYTADDLIRFYDTDFRVYLCFLIAILLFFRYSYINLDKRVKMGEVIAHSALILPLLYAVMSAIVGTQSVVQAKCLSILLRATMDGENQLGNWFTYFVIFMWLAATSFWLTRMNKALSMFDGLFIIPVLQVFWTFFSITSGGIYFEEFNSFSAGQLAGFSSGVAVVFLGVYMLAPGSDKLDANARSLAGNTLDDSFDDMDLSSEGSSRSTQSLQSMREPQKARGYSYDEDKSRIRMLSVWATTNDRTMIELMDKEPVHQIIHNRIRSATGGGAGRSVDLNMGSSSSINSDLGASDKMINKSPTLKKGRLSLTLTKAGSIDTML